MNDILMSSNEDVCPLIPVMATDESVECMEKSCPWQPDHKPEPEHKPTCDFSCVDDFPLAMAYVPMQKFQKLYPLDKALRAGTLFEELDLPFIGGKGGGKR